MTAGRVREGFAGEVMALFQKEQQERGQVAENKDADSRTGEESSEVQEDRDRESIRNKGREGRREQKE